MWEFFVFYRRSLSIHSRDDLRLWMPLIFTCQNDFISSLKDTFCREFFIQNWFHSRFWIDTTIPLCTEFHWRNVRDFNYFICLYVWGREFAYTKWYSGVISGLRSYPGKCFVVNIWCWWMNLSNAKPHYILNYLSSASDFCKFPLLLSFSFFSSLALKFSI